MKTVTLPLEEYQDLNKQIEALMQGKILYSQYNKGCIDTSVKFFVLDDTDEYKLFKERENDLQSKIDYLNDRFTSLETEKRKKERDFLMERRDIIESHEANNNKWKIVTLVLTLLIIVEYFLLT